MRVRRGDLNDVYVENGRSAVFVREQVVVLSEIATVILEATPVEGAASLDQLTSEVVSRFGQPAPPLDARDAVAHQVHDLVAHHVLVTNEMPADAALTPESAQALRDCLAHLVSADPTRWTLPADVTAEQLLTTSQRHRVTPTLARSSGRLDLPPALLAKLAAADLQEQATVAMLAHDLITTIDVLAAADIRCLTFKGLALAVQAHDDISARGTGDIDLLVHPRDLERAHRALTAAGWTPAAGLPHPGPSWAWRHLVRTGNEVALVSDRSMVDLHWHLGPARSAYPDFDALWERSVSVNVNGRAVPTLAPFDALGHSASHAAKDEWGWLRSLLDVHRLIADPGTWTSVCRPLRHDQLLTVGLAARMFGAPDGAPQIVHDSVELTAPVWSAVLDRQSTGGMTHEPSQVPGLALVHGIRRLRWAGAGGADIWRHVSRSAMPEWLTTQESSKYAVVVVPRVIVRRLHAFADRLRSSR